MQTFSLFAAILFVLVVLASKISTQQPDSVPVSVSTTPDEVQLTQNETREMFENHTYGFSFSYETDATLTENTGTGQINVPTEYNVSVPIHLDQQPLHYQDTILTFSIVENNLTTLSRTIEASDMSGDLSLAQVSTPIAVTVAGQNAWQGSHATAIGIRRLFYFVPIAQGTKALYIHYYDLDGIQQEVDQILATLKIFDPLTMQWTDEIIEGVDPATFSVLNGYFAKDQYRVYYKRFQYIDEKQVEEILTFNPADLISFKSVDFVYRWWYMKDSVQVYAYDLSGSGLISPLLADPDSFEEARNGVFTAKDKTGVFIGAVRVDMNSYVELNDVYAKDNNNVFRLPSMGITSDMSLADAATFEVLDFFFAKDRSHVWGRCHAYEGICISTIADADPSTFTPLQSWLSKDRYQVYHFTKPVADADTETFHIVPLQDAEKYGSNFATDKNAVYLFYGNTVRRFAEIDPNTFELTENQGQSGMTAQDKDHEYIFNTKDINEVQGIVQISVTSIERSDRE